ncbi:MAG: ABC transporter permease [Lachnospiraceae bacterium]
MDIILNFSGAVLDSSTSILFAALGILIMQLAGVVNIGAEGMMLIGAFSGVVGSSVTGNAWLGILFAAVATGITGLLFAVFTITLKANQVVVGIALNILAEGITTTLYRMLFGIGASSEKVDALEKIGPFNLLVYIGILLVVVLSIFLYQTNAGLRVRGVGEYPQAIDSVGLHVNRIRYFSVIGGSMIIGVGGSYLSLGQLSFFTENMVTGRGFIALAAVIFGRFTPLGTLFAILVFGSGEAMVSRLQAVDNTFPTHLILMIPYILTMIAVTVFGQKSSGPMALGIPFSKHEK